MLNTENNAQNNLKLVIKYILAFTFPLWLPFSTGYIGCSLSSMSFFEGSTDTVGRVIFTIFLLIGFYACYLLFIQHFFSEKKEIIILSILGMVVYTPVALFVGFFSGWGGMLAGGCCC